jgi:hypothetical protein
MHMQMQMPMSGPTGMFMGMAPPPPPQQQQVAPPPPGMMMNMYY